jgi:hypothetical protein
MWVLHSRRCKSSLGPLFVPLNWQYQEKWEKRKHRCALVPEKSSPASVWRPQTSQNTILHQRYISLTLPHTTLYFPLTSSHQRYISLLLPHIHAIFPSHLLWNYERRSDWKQCTKFLCNSVTTQRKVWFAEHTHFFISSFLIAIAIRKITVFVTNFYTDLKFYSLSKFLVCNRLWFKW